MMLGMKLVGSQALHDQNLCKLESTILNLRSHLLSAQETVAGYGEKFAAKVSFADFGCDGIGGTTTSPHSQGIWVHLGQKRVATG